MGSNWNFLLWIVMSQSGDQKKNLTPDGNRSRRSPPADARRPAAVFGDVTAQPSRRATHLDNAEHQERLVTVRPSTAGQSGCIGLHKAWKMRARVGLGSGSSWARVGLKSGLGWARVGFGLGWGYCRPGCLCIKIMLKLWVWPVGLQSPKSRLMLVRALCLSSKSPSLQVGPIRIQ
jgi:hypothetical protein